VTAYDPQGMNEAKHDLSTDVRLVGSIEDAIKNADAVIIATEWKEFLDYPATDFAKHMQGKILFDAVNQYGALSTQSAGLIYLGIGHNS
jgi:UDPglucose 6-dehydrogenase